MRNTLTKLTLLAAMGLLATGLAFAQTGSTPAALSNEVLKKIAPSDSILTVLPTEPDTLATRVKHGPRNITSGYYLVIRKGIHKLLLYRDGTLLNVFSVGTGLNPKDKTKEGDMATPEGHYNIANIFDSTDWIYIHPVKKTKHKHVYGPWFLSVNTSGEGSFSGESWVGIGIHGTNNDASIGKDVSHGCIRLHNDDIKTLKQELDNAGEVTSIQVDILP